MKKAVLYSFFVVALVNVLGNFLPNEMLVTYSKPLLMPLLGVYFFVNYTYDRNATFYFTLLALLLSWAGDVLLMNSSYFTFGLGAFLLAHICYMVIYYRLQSDTGIKQNRTFVITRIVVVAFAGGALLNVLWPHLGSLTIPVALYTAVIVMMAVFAVLRKDRTSPASFSFIYGGALMFIVSDGMIAVSKFLNPFDHHRMFIMLTYLAAQFFIVKGILAHEQVGENGD